MEKFVGSRGKGDVPIQIYADEEKMSALLKQWDDDVQGHQRAFTAISSQVPEFRDWYAEALSHLRKLQSDNSVDLAAIERLKSNIGAALGRDQPETLNAVLTEYGAKYPRLGGIDRLREDLRQYIELENAVRAGNLGSLTILLPKVRFATPPFQERLRVMAAGGRLPDANVLAQYQAASGAWRQGEAKKAMDGLQKLAGGPWADAVAEEIERKKKIVESFSELQSLRGNKGYDERLLAFCGALDPHDDVYFIDATEADLGQIKDLALKRAHELLGRAQGHWNQYRNNGEIDGERRRESDISKEFRTQAELLADAERTAEQGMRIYTQLKGDIPGQWRDVYKEIKTEAEGQRSSLLELRQVLEPRLLKSKLALIGGRRGEQRESP